ncbi:ribonuclease H family protein [uncultured Clostridium sp.]|uniref:ribonuclease H family protein n=1 Tax=uncultured Clostridium sp. TaxID=59620 RepID=UPI0032175FA5
MATKYYAIKKGKDFNNNIDVNNIIVKSWSECLSYVKGAKGAIYKSFLTEKEAKDYLDSSLELKKGVDNYPLDVPHIYVDGSYNISTEEFGYGLLVVESDIITYVNYGGGKNNECNQRQVNGELKAAIESVKYALDNSCKEIVLFYDYAGVCQHATGAWERNTVLSQEYYEVINKLKKEGNINIIFVKVDSHTNDLYNDIADELAKSGAGLEFDSVVDKTVGNNAIKVATSDVKNKLCKIIKKNISNVISLDVHNTKEFEEKYDISSIIELLNSMDINEGENYLKYIPIEVKDKIILELVRNLK